jgi:hypothetical protein
LLAVVWRWYWYGNGWCRSGGDDDDDDDDNNSNAFAGGGIGMVVAGVVVVAVVVVVLLVVVKSCKIFTYFAKYVNTLGSVSVNTQLAHNCPSSSIVIVCPPVDADMQLEGTVRVSFFHRFFSTKV